MAHVLVLQKQTTPLLPANFLFANYKAFAIRYQIHSLAHFVLLNE